MEKNQKNDSEKSIFVLQRQKLKQKKGNLKKIKALGRKLAQATEDLHFIKESIHLAKMEKEFDNLG